MAVVRDVLLGLRALLNRVLPFTDPKTPLLQDLTPAAALIAFFYFAPRLFERRPAPAAAPRPHPPAAATPAANRAVPPAAPIPRDDPGFFEVEDDEEDEGDTSDGDGARDAAPE